MEEEYKGWKIIYNEQEEIFIAKKGDMIRRGKNLKVLRKRLEKKKKFKRKKALYFEGEEVEVTSISEGRYGIYCWIVYKDKGRERVNIKYIYRITDKNKKLFKEIKEIDKTVGKLDNKRSKLVDQLEKIDFTKE